MTNRGLNPWNPKTQDAIIQAMTQQLRELPELLPVDREDLPPVIHATEPAYYRDVHIYPYDAWVFHISKGMSQFLRHKAGRDRYHRFRRLAGLSWPTS